MQQLIPGFTVFLVTDLSNTSMDKM